MHAYLNDELMRMRIREVKDNANSWRGGIPREPRLARLWRRDRRRTDR